MIKFIQKYERYFYILITIIIVVSFSFFGTERNMPLAPQRDQVAFTALDGSKITRGELEELVAFIQTDALDSRIYSLQSGSNFLNDGVIRKDFLETGMGEELARAYPEYIKSDLEYRAQREKSFKPYVHPAFSFLSADMVWTYMAPPIKENLNLLKQSTNPLSEESFKARVNLYLAEKRFPSTYLMQMLKGQQNQYDWITPDPMLDRKDLSLFGYHSIDDWFGPKFSRLIGEFIINASILAEQKGYRVSVDEAWADLMNNAKKSLKETSKFDPMAQVAESEILKLQLRAMGMDSGKAARVWQKVLLFRRLFHDIANASMVESKTLGLPNAWLSETVTGDSYRLPKALRFSDMMDMAEYELYVARTAEASAKDTLLPPQKALLVEEVMKKSPELVSKRYLLAMKSADLKSLASKVSLKETLQWESDPVHFAELQKEFADLGIKEGSTLDKRVEALSSLTDVMRSKVDAYARNKIVSSRGDWVEQALSQSNSDPKVVTLYLKGGKEALPGVKDSASLMKTLDASPMNQEVSYEGEGVLYRFKVIDRSPSYEVVSFEEARQNGSLAALLTEELEPFYNKVKGQHEAKFKMEGGGYKPLSEVKRQVAELWLEKPLAQVQKAAAQTLQDKSSSTLIPDMAATLRFVSWAQKVKESPEKGAYVAEVSTSQPESDKLPKLDSYAEQFKWRKAEQKIARKELKKGNDLGDKEKLLALKPGEGSPLLTPANGDLSFFLASDRKAEIDPGLLTRQTLSLRYVLGKEAERGYMSQALEMMKAKGAISFDYLDQGQEQIEPEARDQTGGAKSDV